MATAEMLVQAPGWYEGVPMEDYLAIPAMSASGLVKFARSPAHYKEEKDNPKPETKLMAEGTALHMALLEPELFEESYIILGQCEGITGKNVRCSYQGSIYRDGLSFCKTHDPQKNQPMAPGIRVISADAKAEIEGMRGAVLGHPDASRFFAGQGRSEVVGVWIDEATGVPCKIRLDRDIERAVVHADVKTCADASEAAFPRQAKRMGYPLKCAFYRRGMKALGRQAMGSVLIAVERKRPHGVKLHIVDEDAIAKLQGLISRNLLRYAKCERTGVFPGYERGMNTIQFTDWELENAGVIAGDGEEGDDE